MSLTWNERVAMFVVNPESASLTDVSRMAGELKEINKKVERARRLLDGTDKRYGDYGVAEALRILKEE